MTVLTLQPAEADAIDTFIDSGSGNVDTNFGTNAYLQIGEWNAGTGLSRTLIKFDLSSIPVSAIISSAVFTITYGNTDASNSARTLSAYRQKRAWTEAGATWNKYDGASSWQTAGGLGANDCEATDIGGVSVAASPANNTAYDITLTAAKVQEWVSGAFANNGFLLKVATETDDQLCYDSSTNATASYRPKLVVTYTVPGYPQVIVC